MAEPELLGAVRHTDEVLDDLRLIDAAGGFGSGGVATKVAAARMAAYSGQQLEWDQALNGQDDLFPKTLAWDAAPPVVPDENGYYPRAMPGITKVL